MLLDIACLGQFHVLVDGLSARFATDHGRALLSYLAIESDRPHTRLYLAYLLWPDQPETLALNNLRQTLTRLRQSLRTSGISAEALTITPRTLQLNSHAVRLDVQQFRHLVAACKAHLHSNIEQCSHCIQKLEEAVQLYKGEFLQGLSLRHSQPFTEWAAFVREELHQQMLFALQTLAHHDEKRGAYANARTMLARLLAMEPWHEEAHLQLMRVLAKAGQRSAAILQYEVCRSVLAEELGIAPSTEIDALYELIRSDTFGRERELTAFLPESSLPMRLLGDEFPPVVQLVGRDAELAQLKEWLIYQQSQVITIWGMGGMGKTALTAAIAEAVASYYDVVLWYSSLNASTLDELLRNWLVTLGAGDLYELPEGTDAQLAQLLQHLRTQRCLLILDNLESILDTNHAGVIHADFADYAQLFQQVIETQHKSCLLLTSREKLQVIVEREEDYAWIHSLQLDGLDVNAAQILLTERNLALHTTQTTTLVERYSGNPLALKLVAETIHELFGGKIDHFLASKAIFFDDIRAVLEEQFHRLPTIEQDILLWFAVEREPISLATLVANLSPNQPSHQVLQAVRALQRRSLLSLAGYHVVGKLPTAMATPEDANFVLPNVLMEYLVDHLVNAVCQEIAEGTLHHLHTHALMQAQAKEYVGQSQLRLMMLPIAHYLEKRFGRDGVRKKIYTLLSDMGKMPIPPRSYAAGNLLNLLIAMDIELNGLDLSGLAVWQADLRHANLANVNFAGTDLNRSRFADAFAILFCVAASPDGKLIAAGGSNGEIRLWDAESGNLRYVYRGHRGPVRSIAFSPNGKMLASGGADHLVRLWSAEEIAISEFSELAQTGFRSASPLATFQTSPHSPSNGSHEDLDLQESPTAFGRILRGHTARVTSVAFHPTGTMLASASVDQTVRLWDVMSGETRAVLHEHEQPVWAIRFSPDGNTFASADGAGMIYLWDSQRAELQQVLGGGHVALVRSIAFDPKGRWLASAGHDCRLIVWDLSNGEVYKIFKPSQDIFVTTAFSPDGAYLAVAGDEHTIYLFSTETWQHLYPLRIHADLVCEITFGPNNETLISVGVDHLVCVWDLQALRIRHRLSGYSKRINTLAFHPSGQYLVSGHYDRGIRLWDIAQQQVLHTIPCTSIGTNSLAFSGDGTLLASGHDDSNVYVWKFTQNEIQPKRLYVLRGHRRDVTGVIFYTEPQDANHQGPLRLISSGEDRHIGIWELEYGQLSSFLMMESGPLWYLQCNAAGTLLATIDDHNIHLWEMPEGNYLKELRGHTKFVWGLAFSPDGHWLANGGSDGSIALWDISDHTNIKLHTLLHGHTDRIFVVAISPDGKYLACGGADSSVSLWNLHSQELIYRFVGHTHWVYALAFSPDGRTLASGGWDETIRLWNVESGQPLTLLHTPGPYAGMNINGATGMSDAERTILKQLGAVET